MTHPALRAHKHHYPADFVGAVQRNEKHAIAAMWEGGWNVFFFPADPTVCLTFKQYKHKRSAVRAAKKWTHG